MPYSPSPAKLLLIFLATSCACFAQQPKYTPKHFVHYADAKEFKGPHPANGPCTSFIEVDTQVFDADESNSVPIRVAGHFLLCIESQRKDSLPDGIVTTSLIDSADHKKHYRIWEQHYSKGHLEGQWSYYNLKGTLIYFQTYKHDSLDGLERSYQLDGKTILSEIIYHGGKQNYTRRKFTESGVLVGQGDYTGEQLNGTLTLYYENGKTESTSLFKNGKQDGEEIYYYDNGQPWIIKEYKDGKTWEVKANYTREGKSREKGTLKNGNGTVVYYDENGSVRETITYENGEEKK